MLVVAVVGLMVVVVPTVVVTMVVVMLLMPPATVLANNYLDLHGNGLHFIFSFLPKPNFFTHAHTFKH